MHRVAVAEHRKMGGGCYIIYWLVVLETRRSATGGMNGIFHCGLTCVAGNCCCPRRYICRRALYQAYLCVIGTPIKVYACHVCVTHYESTSL